MAPEWTPSSSSLTSARQALVSLTGFVDRAHAELDEAQKENVFLHQRVVELTHANQELLQQQKELQEQLREAGLVADAERGTLAAELACLEDALQDPRDTKLSLQQPLLQQELASLEVCIGAFGPRLLCSRDASLTHC